MIAHTDKSANITASAVADFLKKSSLNAITPVKNVNGITENIQKPIRLTDFTCDHVRLKATSVQKAPARYNTHEDGKDQPSSIFFDRATKDHISVIRQQAANKGSCSAFMG